MSTIWLTMADGLETRIAMPMLPNLSEVCIYTVAHQLGQINRFNGAAARPYCVAEHSLLVLDIMERFMGITSPDVLMLGLMHDAHECLTNDLATPNKEAIGPAWAGFEEPIECAMLKHFDLLGTRNGNRVYVHHADRLALMVERDQLMPKEQPNGQASTPWPCFEGYTLLPGYDLMHPLRVKNTWQDWAAAFVERFVELDAQRKALLS